MADQSQAIELLRSIDATLKELLALSKTKRMKQPDTSSALGEDLDAPGADEIIRAKSPRDWSGPDFKGAHMSECPPELLDLLAVRHDFFAQKNIEAGEQTKAGYERRSAARARAWAARKRAGWKPPATAAMNADEVSW